jgi:polysaccharide export outer membrane protein
MFILPRTLLVSSATMAACGLFVALACSQSTSTQPVSPAKSNASTTVTPQVPAVTPPGGAIPSGNVPKEVAGGTPAKPASPADLLIGAGDLLEIGVFGAPDFDKKEVRVSSSGDVSLPLIGPVRLAGLTTAEAERLVERKLSEGGYYADPHVSIFAKEYQTQGVSVLGEVQKPGIYPMLGSRRLFDVISAAGGRTVKAGNQVTITHRDSSSPAQTLTFAGNGSDSAHNNPEVLPGDTVVVQKAGIVYVVGDVHMPGGFVMDKPQLTVLQALAMAQGANSTAKLDGARLIRRTGDQRQDVPIALSKILSAQAEDINLQPEDILFIPNSRAKSALHRSLEAIVQTATGVAIYSHPW